MSEPSGGARFDAIGRDDSLDAYGIAPISGGSTEAESGMAQKYADYEEYLLEKSRKGDDESADTRLTWPEIDDRLRLLMGSPDYHLPHEEVEPIDDALWMIRTQMRRIADLEAAIAKATGEATS